MLSGERVREAELVRSRSIPTLTREAGGVIFRLTPSRNFRRHRLQIRFKPRLELPPCIPAIIFPCSPLEFVLQPESRPPIKLRLQGRTYPERCKSCFTPYDRPPAPQCAF